MANRFPIEITAADRATATINKIKDEIAKFIRPVTNTQTALAKLGKETGLDKLTKKLGSASGAAVEAAEKLGALGGSASALAGVGSIGGIALLTKQWGDMGLQVTNAAYQIGIGTDQLTRFQAAARLGGISADAMSQGVSSMAKNIGDVLSNRNPQMAGFFQQLGIRARYDANGQADVATAYRDLARALANAPTAQGKNAILDALGQPEELRRAIENMDTLTESAARFRPNAGAAAAAGTELGKSLARLGENVTGIGENMELVLAPGLTKVVGLLGGMAEKANELTRNGFWSHAATIGIGAGTGALGGAAIGALGGAVTGAAAGGVGAIPGAIAGGVIGAIRGGIGGAAVAGGVDLLGHADLSPKPVYRFAMTRTGLQLQHRMEGNNPGNLRVPGQNAFQTFDTPEAGLTAAARNLIRYQTKYGINTLSGIGNRWAPPSENDTGRYVQGMSDATGFLPNEPIDLTQPSTAAAVLSSIVKNEQGKQPFTPDQMAAAVAAALRDNGGAAGQGGQVTVTLNNVPAGTTATAQHSGAWPVRLQYGLPTGATNP